MIYKHNNKFVLVTMVVLAVTIFLCFVQETQGSSDGGGVGDNGDTTNDLQQHYRHRRRLVKEIFTDESDDDVVKVFVGYNSMKGRQHIEMKSDKPIDYQHDFDIINAVAVEMSIQQLKDLENDDTIEYIEQDYVIEPLSHHYETTPYGIRLSGALYDIPSGTGSGNCSDPDTLKVAIVDSGIDGGHSDLPCSGDDDDDRCMGKSFGTSQPWSTDTLSHGTHVAGTIAAIGDNQLGVRGMINDGKICLLVAKVFGSDSLGSTKLSTILDAVRWAVDEGAMILNLSLGGGEYSETSDKFYKEIYENEGRLVVAAAGNNGVKENMYPASFDSVLSVSAIDENEELAVFSSYSKNVNFAAPGEQILSTIPEDGGGGITIIDIDDDSNVTSPQLEASILEYSEVPPSEGLSGTLVECPDLGQKKCPGEGDHICVIERGEITFEEKALNCEKSGGLAAIIYNSEDGPFAGTLTMDTKATIPVVGIPKEAGEDIIMNYLGMPANLLVLVGYGYADGTSMAAPHVAGALAAAWRPCQDQCTNQQVVECFQETAKDLGEEGKDSKYGFGLIQTSLAYKCLQTKCECYQVRRIRHRRL